MNIAQYSLDNKKVIFFFLAILLFGGLLSFDGLGKKEDAPFVIKQAVLFVQYPGATAEQVESLVTEVVERDLQTMPKLYRLKSNSYNGLAKISIELDPATKADDVSQMWDIMRRKMLDVQNKLPEGTTIVINDDFGDVFGLYYGLKADDGFSYHELREWAHKIKRELSVVDGVQQITIYGEQTPVINVKISLSRLANLGLTPQQVMQTVGSQNQLISSGTRQLDKYNVTLFADGTYNSIDDLRNQILTTNSGAQFSLGEIAELEMEYLDPPSTKMRIDGQKALGIAISTPTDKDVVKAGENVSEVLEAMMPTIPIGMEIVPLYSEGQIAADANMGFIINLIESIAIVILILFFVMGARSSFLIGSSIIFSISGTLLIMNMMGVGLNRTSLAGFIIAMGMLVDNAIVVADNTQVNLMRGMNKRNAIINGATAPQWGLLGATFIAICSFLPLALAKAAVAEIVQPLFVVIGVSLGLSWILALTQTTTFANMMFKEPKPGDMIDPYDKPFYHRFEKALRLLIAHRWSTIIATIGIFFLSLYVMGRMPQDFFPALDKEYYRADLIFPNGYSLTEVERQTKEIEEWVMEQPEYKCVSTALGSAPPRYYLASSAFGPLANYANMFVEVKDKRTVAGIEDRFNSYVRENYPEIICRSSLFKVSPVSDAVIEIGFIGANIDTLSRLTTQVEGIMRDCEGVDQVRNSWGDKVPQLLPHYSQSKGQHLAVSRSAMAQSLAITTQGIAIGQYRSGDQYLPILLRDRDYDDFSLSDIGSIPIFSATGGVIPLSQVTDSISYGYQYFDVRHFNRQRYMMAECEPKRGANMIAAYGEIVERVRNEVKLPEGYKLLVLGDYDVQSTSNKALGENLPLTFILIFIALLFLFRSYRKPLVILSMVPLIFTGVVLGLALFGQMFNFLCLLGLLGLIGMNVKNAIVLVDQVHTEIKGGLSRYDALIQATKSRLVPVVMASGTTILGMSPLLLDAMFAAMAATIMGGLFVATILTMFILPVVYALAFNITGAEGDGDITIAEIVLDSKQEEREDE